MDGGGLNRAMLLELSVTRSWDGWETRAVCDCARQRDGGRPGLGCGWSWFGRDRGPWPEPSFRRLRIERVEGARRGRGEGRSCGPGGAAESYEPG